jgi:hypothetical protein
VATGPYADGGSGCPAPDTLFLAAPAASKGSLTQYAGRILRAQENKTTAEVHDHLDERTGVLALSVLGELLTAVLDLVFESGQLTRDGVVLAGGQFLDGGGGWCGGGG